MRNGGSSRQLSVQGPTSCFFFHSANHVIAASVPPLSGWSLQSRTRTRRSNRKRTRSKHRTMMALSRYAANSRYLKTTLTRHGLKENSSSKKPYLRHGQRQHVQLSGGKQSLTDDLHRSVWGSGVLSSVNAGPSKSGLRSGGPQIQFPEEFTLPLRRISLCTR